MQEELIAIKGLKDGLLITLNTNEDWQDITAQLADKIDAQVDFYSGANVTVDLGERPVPKHDLSSLKALLGRRGLTLTVVLSDSDTTNTAALSLDLRTETGNQVPGREPEETIPISPEEKGTDGVMLRRTLRSGRIIVSKGHVVIYGDVNPGAKVIADGDIIIWGRLRGIAHAGASGNEDAVICALDMSPNQLRIAGYIAIAPVEHRRRVTPEIALVRDKQIVVETTD